MNELYVSMAVGVIRYRNNAKAIAMNSRSEKNLLNGHFFVDVDVVVAADASPLLPSASDMGRLRFCPVVLLILFRTSYYARLTVCFHVVLFLAIDSTYLLLHLSFVIVCFRLRYHYVPN